jgi:hypothetical protein
LRLTDDAGHAVTFVLCGAAVMVSTLPSAAAL